jgi:hypothetical protein
MPSLNLSPQPEHLPAKINGTKPLAPSNKAENACGLQQLGTEESYDEWDWCTPSKGKKVKRSGKLAVVR